LTDVIQAAILGFIQGLTEFLPVSSSGHLELVKYFLNDQKLAEESLMMTVVLHFATALSTMYVFRKEIIVIFSNMFSKPYNESQNFSLYILLSMIPAAFVGFFFEDMVAQMYDQKIAMVACMLILTGIILFLADRAKHTNKSVNASSAILIGIAQALAIIPGISRSGATISTSVLLGIDREKAARFSFLMVIPLIFGKILKDLVSGDLLFGEKDWSTFGVGFLVAFITGLFACNWMIALVKRSNLKIFSFYCFAVAILVLFVKFVLNI
jgi:undecaprenyl-diphosphatase